MATKKKQIEERTETEIKRIRKVFQSEIEEIERQVSELLSRESAATQVPDVPEEYRQRVKDGQEGLTDGDID